jgi:hypothetical protein
MVDIKVVPFDEFYYQLKLMHLRFEVLHFALGRNFLSPGGHMLRLNSRFVFIFKQP